MHVLKGMLVAELLCFIFDLLWWFGIRVSKSNCIHLPIFQNTDGLQCQLYLLPIVYKDHISWLLSNVCLYLQFYAFPERLSWLLVLIWRHKEFFGVLAPTWSYAHLTSNGNVLEEIFICNLQSGDRVFSFMLIYIWYMIEGHVWGLNFYNYPGYFMYMWITSLQKKLAPLYSQCGVFGSTIH